jgi:hypothetical protein
MTLVEVLQSNKPFKRQGWDTWIIYDDVKNNGWFTDRDENGTISDIGTSLDLYREDILANDWVVEG